ncbi:MAG: hypothetical protein JWQ95_4547 [Sphaerisporangium sp.]|jgi:uncharacterized protein YbjQ (UPF0145 family)|nr:hypothetical protein [Sphaerisporangium sp.]
MGSVTQWLPPAAQARLRDARGTWTSGLSVPEFAAIRSVGFEPVGQVMGSTVHNLGWWYAGPVYCGYSGGMLGTGAARTITSGMRGGFATYVQTIYEARRTAMGRMAAECAALGGDGVVAVTVEIKPFPSAPGALEFQALGTAVRAQGDVRPSRPFLSHLSGQDFAKLVAAGWVPVDMAFGMSVGVRHDDWTTQVMSSVTFGGNRLGGVGFGNAEVPGWTELVSVTRHEARDHFMSDSARTGADGAVLSGQSLTVRERSCAYGGEQRDHVVEATLIGTSVARFQPSGPPPTRALTIMRL